MEVSYILSTSNRRVRYDFDRTPQQQLPPQVAALIPAGVGVVTGAPVEARGSEA